MKVEFGLPGGAGGLAGMHSAGYVRTALKAWSERHNIPYKTTIVRHDHRAWLQVEFEQEKHLTFFTLSYKDDKSFMGYRLSND